MICPKCGEQLILLVDREPWKPHCFICDGKPNDDESIVEGDIKSLLEEDKPPQEEKE